MKPWALAVMFALSGCATCGGSRVNWPQVVQCGEQVAADLLSYVIQILMGDGRSSAISDSATSKLEDLARQHSPEAIACAVQSAITTLLESASKEETATRAVSTNSERIAADRGRDFLANRAHTKVVTK